MLVGRWASLKSARNYLRLGEAMLAQLVAGMAPELRRLVRNLVDAAPNMFLI